MNNSNTDCIEKRMELKAPVSRVWKALTDYREFNAWFGVNLESPFVAGEASRGNLTFSGYEHVIVEVVVEKIEAERLFSYRWHPGAIDPAVDYSQEPPTLVEFTLESTPEGTLLMVKESGFDAIPAERRDEAFRMNEGGWTQQMKSIADYVTKTA